MVIWEGSLYRGLSAVVIIPTIWEMDDQRPPTSSNDASRMLLLAPGGRWNQASSSIPTLVGPIAKLASDPKSDYGAITKAIRQSFDRAVLIPKEAAAEPTNRPIGMKDRGAYYAFVPEVLVLTYDVAEELRRRSVNGATGVTAINYQDEAGLGGDYTLYVRVERRP